MGRTVAFPEDIILFRYVAGNVASQVAIRDHQQLFCRQGASDADRIGTGTTDITLGFDCGAGVDISNHRGIGVFRFERQQAFRGHHVRHGATGVRTWQQHGFFRGENGRTLGHEMNTAEDNDFTIGVGGLD